MRLFKFAARRRHEPARDGCAAALDTPAQDRIDFADMERALLAEGNTFALTATGALAIRCTSDQPGPTFYWRTPQADLWPRFIRRYLTERGLTALWSTTLAHELHEWLRAGCERHRPSEKFLA